MLSGFGSRHKKVPIRTAGLDCGRKRCCLHIRYLAKKVGVPPKFLVPPLIYDLFRPMIRAQRGGMVILTSGRDWDLVKTSGLVGDGD
jgi:hypothetical protein